MKNTYYTPTIEEFHVGFEYEHFFNTQEGRQWNKQEFTGSCEELMMDTDIDRQVIRVKHLDGEDIESLGFTLKSLGDAFSNLAENYILQKEEGFNTGILYTIIKYPNSNGLHLSWESYSSYGSENGHIRIIIKNKSELERLLKQLNIK